MSFCKYSSEYVASSQTEVDNIFINDYLPAAPGEFVKVYLYGLYLCKNQTFDNTIESFAKHLNMSEQDVEGAFEFWQEQGLVQVLKTYPIEIRYIPLKNVLNSTKLYKPDKYTVFNSQAQELFAGKREITKNEYNEYYDFLERFHVEQEALLMIMKYCIDSKHSAVGWNYILTVAKNWANEGITTVAQVEEKLVSFEQKSQEMGVLLAALGLKRNAYIEERNLLDKWMIEYGFNLDVIVYLAKNLKKKGKANFNSLDNILTHYYETKLLSIIEIEEFEKNKTTLFTLAKNINKAIGVYYESLDSEIENYILKWINYGFEENVLLEIANYCFKNSIRTLEGMDSAVQKFYKLGILSISALSSYISTVIQQDKAVQEILDKLGLARKVNYLDRENYKTWVEKWGMSAELIDYACSLAQGKNMPMQYVGKILANWRENKVTSLQDAQKFKLPEVLKSTKNRQNFTGHSYEDVDVNALFQSINEVDV